MAKFKIGKKVWFISWLSGNVCYGEIFGFDKEYGYGIICESGSMISARKVFTRVSKARNVQKRKCIENRVKVQIIKKMARKEARHERS